MVMTLKKILTCGAICHPIQLQPQLQCTTPMTDPRWDIRLPMGKFAYFIFHITLHMNQRIHTYINAYKCEVNVSLVDQERSRGYAAGRNNIIIIIILWREYNKNWQSWLEYWQVCVFILLCILGRLSKWKLYSLAQSESVSTRHTRFKYYYLWGCVVVGVCVCVCTMCKRHLHKLISNSQGPM